MKTVIVTGSSRGIGRGIADLLDQNGYTVIYSGTKPERPADLSDEKSYFAADISDGTQRRALVAFAMEKYGRLDVLELRRAFVGIFWRWTRRALTKCWA